MTEETESTKTEFDKFASAAMRGPRKNTYMQLLSGLLLKANQNSEPLKKIQTICEAAYLSRQKDKLDMQIIEVSYTLAVILAKVEIPRNPDATIHIPWSFVRTEESWKKYVAPWQNINLTYWAYHTELRHKKYHEQPNFDPFASPEGIWERKMEAAEAIREEIEKMSDCDRFFQVTSALTLQSFYALKSEFENWALTKLLAIQSLIADQVDPKVFSEVLGLMFGQKEERTAEEVEEEK
jgi:hypothetical protein